MNERGAKVVVFKDTFRWEFAAQCVMNERGVGRKGSL